MYKHFSNYNTPTHHILEDNVYREQSISLYNLTELITEACKIVTRLMLKSVAISILRDVLLLT